MRAPLLFLLLLLLLACPSEQVPARPPLLLDHVTVIDGRAGPPQPDRAILVRDGRIVRIAGGGTIRAPAGSVRLDLRGRYLIPGLIDAHVHLRSRPREPGVIEAILRNVLVRSGVTTVRDMGGNGEVIGLSRSAEAGTSISPRILTSALMTGGPSRFWLEGEQARYISGAAQAGTRPWFRHLRSAREAGAAAAAARAWGANGLKAHSGLTAAELAELGAAAQRSGLRFWAHAAVGPARPSDAVAAGATILSHADMLAYEGLTERPAGFDRLPYIERTRIAMAATPVDGEALGRLFRLMRAQGVCLEPTLLVMTPAEPSPTMTAYLAYAAAATARAHREGVAICAGTDALGGSTSNLPRELALMVERARLTPLEAIRAATANNARFLGLADRGVIAPGMSADIVILSRDPSRDMRAIESVELVIARGIVHRRADGGGAR